MLEASIHNEWCSYLMLGDPPPCFYALITVCWGSFAVVSYDGQTLFIHSIRPNSIMERHT